MSDFKKFGTTDNLSKNGTEVICSACTYGPCIIGHLALAESPIETPILTDSSTLPEQCEAPKFVE